MSKASLAIATEDGKLYFRLDMIMNPLVALNDGLPLAFFGKGKRTKPYIEADAAIEWCKKEASLHNKEKYEKIIKVLTETKKQHASEE